MAQEQYAMQEREVQTLSKRNQQLHEQYTRLDIACNHASDELAHALQQIDRLRNDCALLRSEKQVWEVCADSDIDSPIADQFSIFRAFKRGFWTKTKPWQSKGHVWLIYLEMCRKCTMTLRRLTRMIGGGLNHIYSPWKPNRSSKCFLVLIKFTNGRVNFLEVTYVRS